MHSSISYAYNAEIYSNIGYAQDIPKVDVFTGE